MILKMKLTEERWNDDTIDGWNIQAVQDERFKGGSNTKGSKIEDLKICDFR